MKRAGLMPRRTVRTALSYHVTRSGDAAVVVSPVRAAKCAESFGVARVNHATMNADNRLRSSLLYTSIFAALAATACTVPSDDKGDPNVRVDNIVVVGTSVTSALYVSGELGLTTVPKDAADEAVLDNALKVDVRITSPAELATSVGTTECTVPDASKKSVAIGVIIDDSGSMSGNDPNKMRKAATVSFLNTLGSEDRVLLTDYGTNGPHLRDMLCSSLLPPGSLDDTTCSPPQPSFSADKAALVKATEQIQNAGGTPLFESCLEMMPLVDSVKDGRRGVLLLSDGEPNSNSKRDECHAAAKAAQIPVFTVGLGPAAEGDPNVDAGAVKVLRELADATGGSYASANDPAQLDSLFRNMGTALARGSCRTTATIADAATKIVPGTKVMGEVSIGSKGAKAKFEFIAPEKQ
jgi:Mg-chelatase subunit ChlD